MYRSGETLWGQDRAAGKLESKGGDAEAFWTLVDKYSGDLMYIENRAAVTRAADQTEDIKVIIEI